MSIHESRAPDPAALDLHWRGANGGRVTELLSEHLQEGWLEGYLLTGRPGLFSCYEAFVQIVRSMFNQHARSRMEGARRRHVRYATEHGVDLPEVRDWGWQT